MPDFNYIACDAAGVRQNGTISAASRREAAAALAGRALFPVSMEDARPMGEPKRMRRVSAGLLAVTYGQLADLLRSGVPLLRALIVVEKQTSQPGLKAIMEDIRRQVEDGKTLAEAMVRFQSVLGEMAVSMVRAGSEGGFLEEALTRVAQFTEGQDDLKKRTAGALAYPMFLAVVGTIIVTVLVVFFVPQFKDLFKSLDEKGQLPPVTKALLAVSGALRSWPVIFLVAAAIGGIWWARRWLATDEGRWWADSMRLRMPLLGSVFLGLAVSRFCRVLGTLLHNGVPIIRSLQISRDSTGNRVLGDAIGQATENISAGQSLAGPLGASGKFPSIVVEMIAVAEQANNLENVLISVAESQERQTWRKLDITVRLLEPLMLLVLASVILVVIAAASRHEDEFNARLRKQTIQVKEITMNRIRKRRSSGFTLIEVLLVLVILVVLASLAVVAIGPVLRGVKVKQAKTQVGLLKTAINSYNLDVGNYPPNLEALLTPPADAPKDKWNGPYLEVTQIPRDPWGKQYNLTVPGQHGLDFDIGTVDDKGNEIGNWTPN